MKQNSRTYNSIFNSVVGMISAIFNVILNFFVRIVIVRALGEEINGLHSLFQNIISVMALVETSMCTAMIIHLYEPVKHDDVAVLSKILSFCHKIYLVLAAGFFCAGLILNFFLEIIVSTRIPMPQVHLYFFIFTLSITINYLTYTYRIVLFAEQRNRISSIATLVAEVVFRGLAAVIAILLHSYTFFLFCFIGEKLLGNGICYFCVKRQHPGIRCTIREKTSIELRTKIMTTVKPLFVSRIADIVQSSSQGILISILLGNIAIVGYYGNYTLVSGAVGILYSQIGAAFTSSFGNLATEKNPERMYHAYRKSDFVMSSLAIVVCAGYIACVQDFISLAFGTGFLLSSISVIILTLTMFITLLNIPIISVQNATGRHDADVFNMLAQALCSLVAGFIGGKFFGLEGLLIGMLLPLFTYTTIIKNVIIQNRVFGKKVGTVLLQILNVIMRGMIIFTVVLIMTKMIDTGYYIINIILKGLGAVLISGIVLTFSTIKNPYMREMMKCLVYAMKKKGKETS